MLEALNFSFNGVSSQSLGIINVKTSPGLFEEMFLSSVNIQEVKIRNRDKPYYLGVIRDNLQFKLSFALESWEEDSLRNIARTFFVDEYCPLIFDEFPDMIFYCMVSGNSSLLHNGANQGFIELEFYTDSPYAYTVSSTPTYTSATPTFTINNSGDLPIKPELEITKTNGAGNITITNTTNNNQAFTLSSIEDNETVYINCDTETILTDLSDTYRYANFSGDYLELIRGNNSITITGDCSILFRLQFKLLQSTSSVEVDDSLVYDGGIF